MGDASFTTASGGARADCRPPASPCWWWLAPRRRARCQRPSALPWSGFTCPDAVPAVNPVVSRPLLLPFLHAACANNEQHATTRRIAVCTRAIPASRQMQVFKPCGDARDVRRPEAGRRAGMKQRTSIPLRSWRLPSTTGTARCETSLSSGPSGSNVARNALHDARYAWRATHGALRFYGALRTARHAWRYGHHGVMGRGGRAGFEPFIADADRSPTSTTRSLR